MVKCVFDKNMISVQVAEEPQNAVNSNKKLIETLSYCIT